MNEIKKSELKPNCWCVDYSGSQYTFDAFIQAATSFHGYPAPGLILGGRMVTLAMERLSPGILFDAVCETGNCLPDAVQMLTPCTIGNGWLKIIHLGRYALTLYDKATGKGFRVAVDSDKIEAWPEIANWFYKRKPKNEQDSTALLKQIEEARSSILFKKVVQVRPQFMKKPHLGETCPCPLCGEAYPKKHGAVCRGCQGDAPYFEGNNTEIMSGQGPVLKAVPIEESIGKKLLHDMTRIIPGKSKEALFKKGQIITPGDLCRLQQMGRRQVFVDQEQDPGPDWVHEDEAAKGFATRMAGAGVVLSLPPREGKVNLLADYDGMLLVNRQRLEAFNMIPGVMCASRQGYSVVVKGRPVAGTRAIPLYLHRKDWNAALQILEQGPVFEVRPLKKAKVGIMVTGTEVFTGLVQDRFAPIIQSKVEALGCTVVKTLVAPDDRQSIFDATKQLLKAGAGLIVTTAGLSVDPDDATGQGLVDAGATGVLYGAPLLPGAMSLIAKIGQARIIGVPACALYFKTTAFDILLPRVLAGLELTRRDLAQLGHGAFCLECPVCTFPKCPFGK